MKVVYDSQDQVEVYSFSWWTGIILPFSALFLQAFLPARVPFLAVVDLPLLVTIFFSMARRNPISGLATGAALGLIQDALTHLPLGIYGIAKTIVGFSASSLGARIDVENPGARFLLTFTFYLMHNGIYALIMRALVNQPMALHWVHELLAAVVNGLCAVALFAVLDPLKRRE